MKESDIHRKNKELVKARFIRQLSPVEDYATALDRICDELSTGDLLRLGHMISHHVGEMVKWDRYSRAQKKRRQAEKRK